MTLRKIAPTICFILLFILPSLSSTYAHLLSPYKKERIISNQERTKEVVSFKNTEKTEVSVLPQVYSYNPQTLEITDTQAYIFVRADKDVFKVKPDSTLELNYEIVPPLNMEPGTYFNIILFQIQGDSSYLKDVNPVGMTGSLAHLVVLHITDSSSSVYGITSDFAIITLDIVEKGIPFIRPTKIKYTYQNITNYVLNPMGEIQIYNKKGKYPPIYLKINKSEEKLYPGGLMEEEFDIKKYHITDLYNERTILGRFYSGIDENFIFKEVQQTPNFVLIGIFVIFIVALIFLVKAIIQDRKKKKPKKKSVKPS